MAFAVARPSRPDGASNRRNPCRRNRPHDTAGDRGAPSVRVQRGNPAMPFKTGGDFPELNETERFLGPRRRCAPCVAGAGGPRTQLEGSTRGFNSRSRLEVSTRGFNIEDSARNALSSRRLQERDRRRGTLGACRMACNQSREARFTSGSRSRRPCAERGRRGSRAERATHRPRSRRSSARGRARRDGSPRRRAVRSRRSGGTRRSPRP
jgi:hypothetical protein